MAYESFLSLEDRAGVCMRCGKLKVRVKANIFNYAFGKQEKDCQHWWGRLPEEDIRAIEAILQKHVGIDFNGKPIKEEQHAGQTEMP